MQVLERARDSDPKVRKAVFEALENAPIRAVPVRTRASMLARGLAERDAPTRAAAVALLVRWFVSPTVGARPERLAELLAAEGDAAPTLALRALHAAAVALNGTDAKRERPPKWLTADTRARRAYTPTKQPSLSLSLSLSRSLSRVFLS